MYKSAGIFIWLVSTVMAIYSLILPGIIPEGNFRIGLWFIVPFFSVAAIYSFLRGAQRGHWVRFAFILVFFMYSSISYFGAIGVLGEDKISLYIIGMMFVPLVGLLLTKKYRKQIFDEHRNSGKKDYFDIYLK